LGVKCRSVASAPHEAKMSIADVDKQMAQSLQLAPCPHVTTEAKCFRIEAEGDTFDIPGLAKVGVGWADKRTDLGALIRKS
jgi:hypothetical protein